MIASTPEVKVTSQSPPVLKQYSSVLILKSGGFIVVVVGGVVVGMVVDGVAVVGLMVDCVICVVDFDVELDDVAVDWFAVNVMDGVADCVMGCVCLMVEESAAMVGSVVISVPFKVVVEIKFVVE